METRICYSKTGGIYMAVDTIINILRWMSHMKSSTSAVYINQAVVFLNNVE
jgi:hypothetical protein